MVATSEFGARQSRLRRPLRIYGFTPQATVAATYAAICPTGKSAPGDEALVQPLREKYFA